MRCVSGSDPRRTIATLARSAPASAPVSRASSAIMVGMAVSQVQR
ncbi:Uncharacterised protein [Bordetella pertussis]|nr:Uncharacterised protein [Bordetella pertussis]CFP16950.1 Uncharacterised protein [Bordetella pertussis]CPQ13804.1 Uncharacterised protein [Bordetella pertussis]CRE11307.1 Uncharacterised protein [Bordetella pertussis]CRE32958.1 Uncharacterised protein [Bordetella pertussis]